jgi:hypothetical protein
MRNWLFGLPEGIICEQSPWCQRKWWACSWLCSSIFHWEDCFIASDTRLQIKGHKNNHVRPPTWNFVHWLPRYASTTIYRCIALLQLLRRWQHKSRKLWIPVGFQGSSKYLRSVSNTLAFFCDHSVHSGLQWGQLHWKRSQVSGNKYFWHAAATKSRVCFTWMCFIKQTELQQLLQVAILHRGNPLMKGTFINIESIDVAYRWTHLILINVNLVQQDATIQDTRWMKGTTSRPQRTHSNTGNEESSKKKERNYNIRG